MQMTAIRVATGRGIAQGYERLQNVWLAKQSRPAGPSASTYGIHFTVKLRDALYVVPSAFHILTSSTWLPDFAVRVASSLEPDTL